MSEVIFAYGSNMCLGRFRNYGVQPERPGVPAQLQGYSLRFNKRSSDGSGKANLEPRDGAVAWGVLYVIPDGELPVLNRGEVGYSPTRMAVVGPSGPVEAWVYLAIETVDDASLRPYSWYKRLLVDGARSHGLPADYITMLEAIEARDDPDPDRDRRKRRLGCDDETSMADLLSLIVKRWKADFKGISALEIADMLEIPHGEAMAQLRALEHEDSIRLRECQLGQGVTFNEVSMGGASIKIPIEFTMVDTLMAFPNPPVLEDAFYSDRVEYGEFTKRLHLGASQVQHYYFKRDVLERYVKHQDRYTVEEDATGGSVSMTTEYYMSIPEPDQDALGFANVRFGRMTLTDGTEAVGAIAKDLDDLPRQEQHHWAAHEIENPILSKDDKSWADYISESFEGNWGADHTDYVRMLTNVLNEVNSKVGPLFRRTEHPGLHVPVLNTVGEYINAHKELYKLVGADNLRRETLTALLLAGGCKESDFMNSPTQQKGTWALLNILADLENIDWSAFDVVASNRQQDAHRIQTARQAGDYYPALFREDLKKVILELQKLASPTAGTNIL